MLRIIAKSLKTGVLTETQPFAAPAWFGFPVIDFSRCVASNCAARTPRLTLWRNCVSRVSPVNEASRRW